MTGTPVEVPVPNSVTRSIAGSVGVDMEHFGRCNWSTRPGFFEGTPDDGFNVNRFKGTVAQRLGQQGDMDFGRMSPVKHHQFISLFDAIASSKGAALDPYG
jgi:hypothetical protein